MAIASASTSFNNPCVVYNTFFLLSAVPNAANSAVENARFPPPNFTRTAIKDAPAVVALRNHSSKYIALILEPSCTSFAAFAVVTFTASIKTKSVFVLAVIVFILCWT